MQKELESTTRFGSYQILRKIGAGGMADVYEAVRVGLANFQTRVALKCILPSMTRDERFVRMFTNEAHLGSQLHHPNIIQIQDFNKINDTYYIAMEFVEGVDLARIISRMKERNLSFPPTVVIDLCVQALAGLGYAHEARDAEGNPMNIVHRDVKPSNFIITPSGMVKVGDFGIAKAANSGPSSLTGDHIKGSINYMSPEQIDGTRLDTASDLFGMGIILFELLTLRPLFDGPAISTVLLKIAMVNIESDLALIRNRYPAFEPVLRRALQRDPADRYPNAAAMIEHLRQVEKELDDGLSLRDFLAMHPELLEPPLPHEGQEDEFDVKSQDLTPIDRIRRPDIFGPSMEGAALDLSAFEIEKTEALENPESIEADPASPDLVEDDSSINSQVSFTWYPESEDASASTHSLAGEDEPEGAEPPPPTRTGPSHVEAVPELPMDGIVSDEDDEDDENDENDDKDEDGGETAASATAPAVTTRKGNRLALLFAVTLGVGLATAAFLFLLFPFGHENVSSQMGDGSKSGATAPHGAASATKTHLTADEGTGTQLSISSEPPGATIILDGKEIPALTPTSLPLPADKNSVVVEILLDGYKPFAQKLSYEAGRRLSLNPTLVRMAKVGTLRIVSHPPGASIALDGTPTGQTAPATLNNIPAAKHKLTLTFPGRKTWTRTVDVGIGETLAVEAQLAPLPRRAAKPDRAPNRNNPPRAARSTASPPVPIEREGAPKAAATVYLTLNTIPPDADVYVDGKRIGRVPISHTISAGEHKITFKNVLDNRQQSIVIQASPGERRRIVWDFEEQHWKAR